MGFYLSRILCLCLKIDINVLKEYWGDWLIKPGIPGKNDPSPIGVSTVKVPLLKMVLCVAYIKQSGISMIWD